MEEVRRARCRERSTELPCPPQACYFPNTVMFLTTQKVSEPCCVGIFMELSLHMYDWLIIGHWCLTQLLAPVPSLEVMAGGRKLQPSRHALLFSADQATILKPSRSTGSQSSLSIQDALTISEAPRVLRAVCQELGAKTNVDISYFIIKILWPVFSSWFPELSNSLPLKH